jgi:AcrR family transcriptional regulator
MAPGAGASAGSGTGAGTAPARRRGRPPKADAGDTKRELLQAALELFAARGFEGTSVRDIARAVGLSESVLYAHFDSKRAIFDAVFAQLGPLSAVSVLQDVEAGAVGDGAAAGLADPPAFIRSLIARTMDVWAARPARQLISLMAHDDLLHDPALTAGIYASIGSLAGVFGRWIDAGLLPGDLGSPLELAYALMSPVALARVLWLHNGARPEEIEAARSRAERHAELFIRAVFR